MSEDKAAEDYNMIALTIQLRDGIKEMYNLLDTKTRLNKTLEEESMFVHEKNETLSGQVSQLLDEHHEMKERIYVQVKTIESLLESNHQLSTRIEELRLEIAAKDLEIVDLDIALAELNEQLRELV
jgi:chromosome segregation ATPase